MARRRTHPSEFYFTGAVVLPPFVAYAADVSLAILVFVFLLLAGAVCAIAAPDGTARKPPPDPR
jgi:hypothetical protein